MLTQQPNNKAVKITVTKWLFAPLLMAVFVITFTANAFESPRFGFFIKNEVNDNGYISGIGAEMWLTNQESNFGVAALTSIGYAEVTGRDNNEHDYLAWEAGLKLGYFSNVFAYAEVGFDLGELAFHDRDEDDELGIYYGDDDNNFVEVNRRSYDGANNIDGYVGVGAGFKFDHLQIEAFTRLRQIDGEYWKADNQAFTGAKLSVVF